MSLAEAAVMGVISKLTSNTSSALPPILVRKRSFINIRIHFPKKKVYAAKEGK